MRFFYRKHKTLIKFSIILLLPILCVVGIKAYLWYSTKNLLEQYKLQFADVIKLDYKDISNSLQGSATVHGITLFIPAVKETVHIGSIRLKTSGIFDLLTLPSKFEDNEPPNSLSLSIDDFAVQVNGKMLNIKKEQDKQSSFERMSTLACGDVLRFDGNFLKDIGYSQINSNIDLSYKFNTTTRRLKFTVSDAMDDLYSFEFSLEINRLNSLSTNHFTSMVMMPGMDSNPKVGKISLKITDELFTTRKNIFCAQKNNSTKDEYINKHIDLVQQMLSQLGISVDKSLVNAYRTTLDKPGTVEVSLNLADVDNFMSLASYTPNEIISMLNTKLFVNEQEIKPLFVYFSKKSSRQHQQDLKLKDDNVKPKIVKRYHRVDKSKLRKYDKYPVKLTKINGQEYNGQLVIHNQFNYEILTRTRGGVMSYHVILEDIKSAEVFY